jgi:C-terminal processing protease CtpA/Prc
VVAVLASTLVLSWGCSWGGADQYPQNSGGTPFESSPSDTEKDSSLAVHVLGVETRSVDDAAGARRLGLPVILRGALVMRVIPGTPAGKAGLRRGDVITEIRSGRAPDGGELGHSVESTAQLEFVLKTVMEARRLDVEIFRGPAPLKRSSYATRLIRIRLR